MQQHLEQEDKEWVSNNLSRESEDEKLRDLLRWTESLRKRSLWKVRQFTKGIFEFLHCICVVN